MNSSCINLSYIKKTEGGKKIMEWYPDGYYSPRRDIKFSQDDLLTTQLALWRKVYGKGDDEFPSTKSSFSYFMNTRYKNYEENVRRHSANAAAEIYRTRWATFTTQEYRDVLDRIAKDFVLKIDKYQSDKKHRNLSREKCLKRLGGFDKLMDSVFSLYETLNEEKLRKLSYPKYDAMSDAQKQRADKVVSKRLDLFKRIVSSKAQLKYLAIPRINDFEGELAFDYREFDMSENEQVLENESGISIDIDDDSDSNAKDSKSIKGDRYVDVRTLDINETISVKARQILSKIKVTDLAGKPIVSSAGAYVTMNPRVALTKLFPILYSSTPKSFLSDLQDAVADEPWIANLIEVLKADPEAETAIFTNAKRMLYNYSSVYSKYNSKLDRYEYHVAHNNRAGTSNAIANMLEVNQQGIILGKGKYSIYDAHGIVRPIFNDDSELLKPGEDPGRGAGTQRRGVQNLLERSLSDGFDFNTVLNGLYVNTPGDAVIMNEEGLYKVKQGGRKGSIYMRFFLEKNPKFVETLAELCQGIGLEVNPDIIRKIALMPMTQKQAVKYGSNRLKLLVTIIGDKYAATYHSSGSHISAAHGKDFYDDRMRMIFGEIFNNETLDNKAVFGTKSYQTYSTGNLIHQVAWDWGGPNSTDPDKLEAFHERFEKEFLRYEGMSKDLRKVNDYAFVHNYTTRVTPWGEKRREYYGYSLYKYDGASWNFVKELTQDNSGGHTTEGYPRWHNFIEAMESPENTEKLEAMDKAFFVGEDRASFRGVYTSEAELKRIAGIQLTGWLKQMWDDKFYFGVSDMMQFNNIDVKDLKDNQVNVMQFIEWVQKQSVVVPVQSDYEVINTVAVPNGDDSAYSIYRGEDGEWKRDFIYHDGKFDTDVTVVQELAREVMLEYDRIQGLRKELQDPMSRFQNSTYASEGVKFYIFPEFNTNGFEAKFREMKSNPEMSGAEVVEWVRQQVASQLWNIYRRDIERFEDLDCFNHPAFLPYTEEIQISEGRAGKTTTRVLTDEGRLKFQAFSLNKFYATQQMAKILVGGICHFSDKKDFEKRFMMMHAPRTPMYTEARWQPTMGFYADATEKVINAVDEDGDACQRVVYLQDVREKSKYLEDMDELLDELLKEGRITKQQRNRMHDDYSKICLTDGQGIRTLDSYRAIRIASGSWNQELEFAYQRIDNGTYKSEDIDVFLDVLKPVYTGYEAVPMMNGKLVRMPVLHKYSETVLLPLSIGEDILQTKNTPWRGLARTVKELKDKGRKEWERMIISDPSLKQRVMDREQSALDLAAKVMDKYKVDLFLFNSGCKVGMHSYCAPFVKTDENGKVTSGTIKSYMVDQIEGQRDDHRSVHYLKLKYYGMTASLPGHAQDSMHTAAEQSIRVAQGGIMPGESSIVGEWKENEEDKIVMDSSKLVELYDNIELASIVKAYRDLMADLGNQEKLTELVNAEIGSHSYNNDEIRWAMAKLDDGLQALPLFSPKLQKEVQNILTSIIRKRMTRRRMPGTGLVQVTSMGLDQMGTVQYWEDIPGCQEEDRLPIKFSGEGKDKHIEYVGVYIPCPDSKLLEKYKDARGGISHERLYQLVDEGKIPESFLYGYGYRTPADAPHSVIPFKIWGFLPPSMGSNIIMPKEIMRMTGHDYDGDKIWFHFKHIKEVLDDEVVRKAFEASKGTDADSLLQAILNANLDNIEGQTEDNAFAALEDEVEDLNTVIEDEAYNEFKKKFKKALRKGTLSEEEMYAYGDPYKFIVPEYDYQNYRVEKVIKNADGTETTVMVDAPWMATEEERNNAKVDLMFALLTSPGYTRRMILCGGFDESKVEIKTIELTRLICETKENREKFARQNPSVNTRDTSEVYEYLVRRTESEKDPLTVKGLDSMIEEYSSSDNVFSAGHYGDSFQYMVGTANMIGIYAMYNSALSLLQKAHITYQPYEHMDDNGVLKRESTRMFGAELNGRELCNPIGITGLFANMASSRLINVAVDNGKDPLLGFVNQNPDFAPLTAMMLALGLTEQQIHLFMCQPAMQELAKRKKLDKTIDIQKEMKRMTIEVLSKPRGENAKYFSYEEATGILGNRKEKYYSKYIADSFLDIKYGSDIEAIDFQAAVLMYARNIMPAADVYSELVKKFTRPESSSGSFADTICNEEQKLFERRQLFANKNLYRIGNIRGVMALMDVEEGDIADVDDEGNKINPLEKLYDKFVDLPLKKESALNVLEHEKPMDFILSWYFPQAQQRWRRAFDEIGYLYGDRKIPKGAFDKVAKELMLYKMLSSPTYAGKVEQVREDLVVNLPKRLQDLQQRIKNEVIALGEKNEALTRLAEAKGKEDEYADIDLNRWQRAAEREIDKGLVAANNNPFLAKLKVDKPEDTKTNRPRIKLNHGGTSSTPIGGSISDGWGDMMRNPSQEIKQMAWDLFEYSLFTTGVGYGMYEFGHFAPMDVLLTMKNYRSNLYDLLHINIDTKSEDFRRFKLQYVMNHWQDKNLVPRVDAKNLSNTFRNILGLQSIPATETRKIVGIPTGEFRLVLKGNQPAQLVYMDGQSNLHLLEKLSTKAAHGYTYLQYNPELDPDTMTPMTASVNTVWKVYESEKIKLNADATANTEAPNQPDNLPYVAFGRGVRRLAENPTATAEDISEQKEIMQKTEEAVAAKPTEDTPAPDSVQTFENGSAPEGIDYSSYDKAMQDAANEQAESAKPNTEDYNNDPFLSAAAFGRNRKGKLFQLVRVREDENDNTVVVTENVPATPGNIVSLRKQKASVELNKKLRAILERAGVGIGTMPAEDIIALGNSKLRAAGITDLDTMPVFANGLYELIRLSEGEVGEAALPEEFAHVALEMLGMDSNPLVSRLLNELHRNHDAIREAFGDFYDEYIELYNGTSEEGKKMMVMEAAGKLVAKALIRQQEIKTGGVRGLIHRIVEAIKSLFRRIGSKSVHNAIMESEGIANTIASELLSGKLADQLSIEKIGTGRIYYQVEQKTEKNADIIDKLIQIEVKRASIIERRLGHNKKFMSESDALRATQETLNNLHQNVQNLKTEEVITQYMSDALVFLKNAEESLDTTIANGASQNVQAKKLNTIRDTIFSFSEAVSAVRGAIMDGKITNTEELEKNLDSVSGVIEKFMKKADNIGMILLESTLEGVYGKEGLTVTVGKDKGRKISIQEMARMSDGDIGFAARWLNSLADCNDYVLKSIDHIVRNAKYEARGRAQEYAKKLDAAINALKKATGSTDQSFMFERDASGKKTGQYISATAAMNLSSAQKKFYDTVLAMKKEIDKYVPKNVARENGIVTIPKSAFERVKDADSVSGKWETIKDNIDRSWKVEDDNDSETRRVITDFANNRVDMIPLKYVNKAPKASYDDMTDDVASSIAAYAGMAFEYNNLYGVIGILENARYMSSMRDVKTDTGGKGNIEHVEYSGLEYTRPFTVKQARTKIQEVMDDFFQMQIYGHMQKAEGKIGDTNLDARKVANKVQNLTTLSQMAINLPQRISNVTTGMVQIAIETFAGNTELGGKNIIKATAEYIKQTGDRLAETGAEESHNKLSLFNEKFDIGQRENDASRQKQYGKSRWRKIFNTHLLYAGLTIGEDYLSSVTGLALAYNYKLKLNGKTINLYDAFEVAYTNPDNKTGAYLKMRDGVTKTDGTPFTYEDEFKFMKKAAGINFKMQGIYNLDDRNAIQKTALGSLMIMYRKWIAPSIQRRYGKTQYSDLTEQYEEGYHRTAGRLAKDVIANMKTDGMNIINSVTLNWNKLTDYEKTNVRRSISEFGILAGICLCVGLLEQLPPDDDNDDKTLTWRDNVALYQLLRLRNEVGSLAPTPMLVQEGLKILSSPVASINVLKNALRAYELLIPANYEWYAGEDAIVKSGRFKGHSKAYKYFWSLPILSMRKSVENAIDPEPLINYYK